MRRALARLLAGLQVALGLRVVWRLARSGGDEPIRAVAADEPRTGRVAIVIPVLNEAARLGACLDGAVGQSGEVVQILVVDSGSTDGTAAVVSAYARRDARVRLVAAGPAPADWNGKVWGLHLGERNLDSAVEWLLILDADAQPKPGLARALVARARSRQLRLLSVATGQRLARAADGLVHPALLATLVYRYGRPGGTTRAPGAVLANGQCTLVQRDLLHLLGGFQAVRHSLCEDVTLARLAARAGDAVGFYETDDLVTVAMYADWRETWRNWPRSLATRDALFGLRGWLGLVEVLLVQALPLPLLLVGHAPRVNLALLLVRVGMLVGTARAYPHRPRTYWLSPLLDLPAALVLWRSALATRHAWRGRTYTRRHGRLAAAA